MKIKFLIYACLMFLNIPCLIASNSDLDETIQNITQQLTKEIKTSGESIAIPPFLTFDNKTTALGKLLSEKLITKFAETKILTPVERDFIFKLIDEMKLGMTGLIEPKTIQQVGKFSGANYVLVGTIQKVGKDIQINSRLVRTETSKVVNSFSISIKNSPEFLELILQEVKTEHFKKTAQTEDFEELRKNYSKLQDEFESLKNKIIKTKDKTKIDESEKKIQQLLIASEYKAKGSIAYQIENYDDAITYYSKAIEIYPNYTRAYLGRGGAYGMKNAIQNDFPKIGEFKKTDDWHNEIKDYSKAIEIEPNSARAYNMRGSAYEAVREYENALRDFNKEIELEPKEPLGYSSRANIYERLGDFGLAIKDYTTEINMEKNPSNLTYFLRGICYDKKGDLDLAIKDYGKVIEMTPDYGAAYYSRAESYRKMGSYEKAKKDFEKACNLGHNKACQSLKNFK